MWIRITFCHYCTYLILTHFQSPNTMQIFSLAFAIGTKSSLGILLISFLNKLRSQMMVMFLQISFLWNVTDNISYDRVVGSHLQKNKESSKVPNTPKHFLIFERKHKKCSRKFWRHSLDEQWSNSKNYSTIIFPNVSFV